MRATRRIRHRCTLVVSRRGPVDSEAVKLLLDSGAETDAQNDKGWTALLVHIASQEGAVDVVKCLVLATGRADTDRVRTSAPIAELRYSTVYLPSQNTVYFDVRLLIEAGAGDPFARPGIIISVTRYLSVAESVW
jgi:Ankyrin repeats (many copies)